VNRRRKSIIVIVAAVLTVAITGWAKSMLATPDAAKVTGASGCCAFGSGYYHSPPLW
jgi:hypothetical protein